MSNTPKDGGSAFPLHLYGDLGKGMTLRDWFAGQAVSGSVAYANFHESDDARTAAEYAYRVADAMLEAREEVEP